MADDANEALERLRGKLGPKRAELWLKGATVRIDGGHTVVVASNPFQKSGLETHCVELIDSLFGDAWSVETVERPSVPARRQLRSGPGNNLALKLVRAFVEGGPRAPELLVLFGARGTGKSLLADWAAALGKREVFRLDLARLRRGASRRLTPRKKLVVADGVEALAGAEGSQRVLCRIMDEVRDRGGRFMLTLQGHPHGAEGLTSALRNRLLGGVAVELDLPRPPARGQATLARLLDVAAGAFRVDRAQLASLSRRRGVVEARRTVMSVAVRGGFPRKSVASALGLKSERSVREGCRWVERQKERDPRFAALVHEVERVLPSK